MALMDRSRKHMSTADLAARGEEVRGHSDDQVVSRSARDAAETFVRQDPSATGASAPLPSPDARPLQQAPHVTAAPHHDPSSTRTMLFPHEEAERFRTEWTNVQSAFVDSPREAVERADSLVADAVQRLAATFARERSTLEHQWDRGGDVTTEDLRLVLQRYRSFFDRLLSV